MKLNFGNSNSRADVTIKDLVAGPSKKNKNLMDCQAAVEIHFERFNRRIREVTNKIIGFPYHCTVENVWNIILDGIQKNRPVTLGEFVPSQLTLMQARTCSNLAGFY